MANKKRMGRNLNALLGGATRNRAKPSDSAAVESSGPGLETPQNDSHTDTLTQAEKESSTVRVSAAIQNPATKAATALSSVPSAQAIEQATQSNSQTDGAVGDGLIDAENLSDHEASNASNNAESTVSVIGNVKPQSPESVESDTQMQSGDRLRVLGVDQIKRGEYQPRRHFDKTLLQELADSLLAQGLIQPILVRPAGASFELIAGERRWRAAQLAGITEIPAIVRDLDDQSVAAVSLIENIQRADLNPLEEAQALERLCDEFSMTHQAVAEAVGRSRASVTNLMRLLELHDEVKQRVDNGELDMGHARALLGASHSDQPDLARRIIKQGMTVRAVEKLVRDLREGKPLEPAKSASNTDPNIAALSKKIGGVLGAPVTIKHQKNGGGKLEISYSSLAELDGILAHIK